PPGGDCPLPRQTRHSPRRRTSMNCMRRVALAAAVAASAAIPAHGADYPSTTVRMVVPYSAGGTSDILGRGLAAKLSERLGKPVIVDNRAGAGGSIGTEAVVRSDPDG